MRLILGVSANLALLGYFKYSNFFLDSLYSLAGVDYNFRHIILPLAISFYTFQQITYLVDLSKDPSDEKPYLDYLLFVTFFPQLIAGPIVHHREMMPQFLKRPSRTQCLEMFSLGLFLFGIGLFKKVVVADTFSPWVGAGFSSATTLTLIDSWVVALSYTFQLYFDFSGYSDMAIGLAMMLGIRLPWNFNSPYKSLSIQDFWRCWHMTLSRFLRDYVYIPLGGSRCSKRRVQINLFLTFLLGGIWHGAGWTFIIWGALHGVACIIHRAWTQSGMKLPRIGAWILTFLFVNFAWVFFRAENLTDAFHVLGAMIGLDGVGISPKIAEKLSFIGDFVTQNEGFMPGIQSKPGAILMIAVAFVVTIFLPSSYRLSQTFKPCLKSAIAIGLLLAVSIVHLDRLSEFLYFQF
ncbi:MBOAT family protein [Akkermansiaceae bacterium]|nr:MBOAT family protein [Akkermansiaceae bacterium]